MNKNKIKVILIIIFILICLILVVQINNKLYYPFPNYSSDVSYSDLKLCINDGSACLDEAIVSLSELELKDILICGIYESSYPTQMNIVWGSNENSLVYGVENELVSEGKFQKCFSFLTAINTLEKNNRDEDYFQNPMIAGKFKTGVYYFKVEQGRYLISKFIFSIIE